jgi:hypothetical protein
MSTSHGKPLDHSQVLLVIQGSKSGFLIENVSKIPVEREVVFLPGAKFTVLDRIEIPPNSGRFFIMLKE